MVLYSTLWLTYLLHHISRWAPNAGSSAQSEHYRPAPLLLTYICSHLTFWIFFPLPCTGNGLLLWNSRSQPVWKWSYKIFVLNKRNKWCRMAYFVVIKPFQYSAFDAKFRRADLDSVRNWKSSFHLTFVHKPISRNNAIWTSANWLPINSKTSECSELLGICRHDAELALETHISPSHKTDMKHFQYVVQS